MSVCLENFLNPGSSNFEIITFNYMEGGNDLIRDRSESDQMASVSINSFSDALSGKLKIYFDPVSELLHVPFAAHMLQLEKNRK